MKKLFKKLPTLFKAPFTRMLKSEWQGNFDSWLEASKNVNGYNANIILDKVSQALLKVKNGEAVYERDSVLFDKIQYSWPLLSGLMWIAATRKGKLNVIDFGGSLGSSYYQNKLFLDTLDSVRWNIVEQESFVTRGKSTFQNQELRFFLSVDECINSISIPDAVLFSCVLPYIEEPYKVLEEIMNFSIPHIIIDNTPFNFENRDRICLQKVPAAIYKASIPCWLLNYEKLLNILNTKYMIIAEYKNDSFIYVGNKKVQYQGLLAKLKPV